MYAGGLWDRSDISGHARMLGAQATHTASYFTRGNATQVTRVVLGSPEVSLSTRMDYDIAGNVRSVTDPKTNTTTVEFNDRFGTPDDEAQGNTQAPIELGTLHTYAFATKVTSAAPFSHTQYTQYDYYLGKPVNGEDANGTVSSGRYGGYSGYTDLLDRPTEVVVAANVSSLMRRTRFTYNDTSHLITTQSDQSTLNDGVLTSAIVYDGLGRTTETRTSAPEGTIYSSQEYDAMGRVKRTYNPYRTTGDPTYGYADTSYDGLGRVLTVTTSDGAVVTTTYSANSTTVTDQATRQRRSVTDGLGRLTRVDEPNTAGSLGTVASPTQPTSYVYDVLDDLSKVTQGGQTRYFMYDSLKRLIRSRNPEQDTNTNLSLSDPLTGNSQWSLKYLYDENSNLLTRTDARGTTGITTAYVYDALNRLTSRTYTNDPQSTPAVSYKYDNQTLPTGAPTFARGASIGRLIAVTYGTGSAGSYQGYDQLGRVNVSYQQTDSQNYGFSYGYNLASEMTSETYPSGRQVISEYDTAGRAAGVRAAAVYYAGAAASDATYRIQYASHGAVSVMKLGNGKWEHTAFNNRLQPMQIGLGTSGTDSSILRLDYEYTSSCQTGNNGNVLKQTITAPGLSLIQNYCYDSLNRLSSASENSGANWSQTYGFDRWGNRWVSASPGFMLSPLTPTSSGAFNTATNRLFASGYDFAGNQTSDAQSRQFTYDAENRQLTFNGTGGQYFYDGDGHRVKKVTGSVTTVFVYNASGQLTAEYTNDTTPPVGGGGTSYLTSDHLGSTRVVAKSDGTVKARYDYLPFGEELGAGIGQRTTGMGYNAADSTKQKFTQKERDNESGLDYFLARYYSSAQGRFTSPDEFQEGPHEFWIGNVEAGEKQAIPYGDLGCPQSLNKYQYAYNNPLRYVDPDGHDVLSYELLISGPNNVPKPPNREGLPHPETLGPQTTARGGDFNLNLKVTFDQNDNVGDYKHVRAAIILNSNEPIRNDGAENPDKSQIAVVGQTRFVTDAPGAVTGGPRAGLAGKSFVIALAAGEYDTKTKTLSQNVAYYAVRISFDKNGAVDTSKTVAGTLTKDQFVALAKQHNVNLPKDKNKQDCPQCLLSPPNPERHDR